MDNMTSWLEETDTIDCKHGVEETCLYCHHMDSDHTDNSITLD